MRITSESCNFLKRLAYYDAPGWAKAARRRVVTQETLCRIVNQFNDAAKEAVMMDYAIAIDLDEKPDENGRIVPKLSLEFRDLRIPSPPES